MFFYGIVHFMNNKNEQSDDYRSLLLLDEISKGTELTQRDLSKKLNVALGLVNSYVKNLVSKGYITVSTIPRKRYKYYLTPSGFAEKTRLTYQHLQNFTNLYRVARRDFSTLFDKIEHSDIKKVVFCGVDEVAEIAFLSFKETGLKLTGVLDSAKKGTDFFGHTVRPLEEINNIDCGIIVITSFQGGEALKDRLIELGVARTKICDISAGGWLKKVEV